MDEAEIRWHSSLSVALALLDINVSPHLKTMEVGEGWGDFLSTFMDTLLDGKFLEGLRDKEGSGEALTRLRITSYRQTHKLPFKTSSES